MFTYAYDIKLSAWVVILDGHVIDRFMTEAEAKAYCDRENAAAKGQTR